MTMVAPIQNIGGKFNKFGVFSEGLLDSILVDLKSVQQIDGTAAEDFVGHLAGATNLQEALNLIDAFNFSSGGGGSDTAAQIKAKLEQLTGNNRLNVSAVNGAATTTELAGKQDTLTVTVGDSGATYQNNVLDLSNIMTVPKEPLALSGFTATNTTLNKALSAYVVGDSLNGSWSFTITLRNIDVMASGSPNYTIRFSGASVASGTLSKTLRSQTVTHTISGRPDAAEGQNYSIQISVSFDGESAQQTLVKSIPYTMYYVLAASGITPTVSQIEAGTSSTVANRQTITFPTTNNNVFLWIAQPAAAGNITEIITDSFNSINGFQTQVIGQYAVWRTRQAWNIASGDQITLVRG